jgi:hypothetical protein
MTRDRGYYYPPINTQPVLGDKLAIADIELNHVSADEETIFVIR